MRSLRARLFFILIATTGLIWLAATAWIYVGTRGELERVLDTRLQEAARMVSSLVRDGTADPEAAITAIPSPGATSGYERQLSCQIWSLGGRLVAASTAAPSQKLSQQGTGFSDSLIDGEAWRVYAIEDEAKGVRVLVGDRLGLRDRLVADLVLGLLAPAVLMLPLFAALIWLSIGRGLQPLRAMAADLKDRAADDLWPMRVQVVDELQPVTSALDGLFLRLEAARRHEREITAFAAHELRTPLAGIRTQAQIAIGTPDAQDRRAALDRIIAGVDRAARLVRQLLALARLDAAVPGAEVRPLAIGALIHRLAEEQRDSRGIGVEIDSALDEVIVNADAETLLLALRNLHENALDHSPPGDRLRWSRTGPTSIAIDDEGPGIADKDMPFVTQRFYRGRGETGPGSGLGLAIVEAALRRQGATLRLGPARDGYGGLRAEISFAQMEHARPGVGS